MLQDNQLVLRSRCCSQVANQPKDKYQVLVQWYSCKVVNRSFPCSQNSHVQNEAVPNLYWLKMGFICMRIKNPFIASYLASVWNRSLRQLRNGLLTCYFLFCKLKRWQCWNAVFGSWVAIVLNVYPPVSEVLLWFPLFHQLTTEVFPPSASWPVSPVQLSMKQANIFVSL